MRTVTERGFTSQWTVKTSKSRLSIGTNNYMRTLLRVYLHYHDYILDGRWVVTQNIDSDDKTAVVRNKGDGWDDEECPEKETYNWELRSKRSGFDEN